jgi:hypothetical protein
VLLLNAAAHLASSAAIEDARLLRRDVYNHCYRLGTLAIDPDEQTEVGKLIDVNDWALDQAAYDRTEKALLDQKIIKAKPSGAYTHDVTDAAKG